MIKILKYFLGASFIALALFLTLITGDLKFVLIPIPYILIYGYFFGNIFFIDPSIKSNKVYLILITGFFAAMGSLMLSQKSNEFDWYSLLITIFSFGFLTHILFDGFVVESILLAGKNLKNISNIFWNYLIRFSIFSLFGIVLELWIVYKLVGRLEMGYFTIVAMFFWLISSLLRVIIQFTEFIRKEDMNSVELISKLYGLTRASYYLLTLKFFAQEFHPLLVVYFFTIMYFGYLVPLLPYLTASDEFKNTILTIKKLNKKRPQSIESLARETGVKNTRTQKWILAKLAFLIIALREHKEKWMLNPIYRIASKRLF
ncbi:hypothetical protein GF327_04430 [Candidatus Woesearchaeota archaeon]|nr:hypothetical protein [Candidatus Woesearchaeota archaeon]